MEEQGGGGSAGSAFILRLKGTSAKTRVPPLPHGGTETKAGVCMLLHTAWMSWGEPNFTHLPLVWTAALCSTWNKMWSKPR